MIQAYPRKQEKSKISNLTLHLKKLEKEQTKPKVSRRKEIMKFRAEINKFLFAAIWLITMSPKKRKKKSWFYWLQNSLLCGSIVINYFSITGYLSAFHFFHYYKQRYDEYSKKIIEKINETKSLSLEKVNKIDKPLARHIKKKRERAHINKIRMTSKARL